MVNFVCALKIYLVVLYAGIAALSTDMCTHTGICMVV
jgi:hypothetical protein